MQLSIDLQNETDFDQIPSISTLELWAKTALEEAGYDKPSDIAIRFVSNSEIQALNRNYRNKDQPTNVLSFPFEIPDFINEHIPTLGDIIIAINVIEDEAIEQHKNIKDHLAHMIIHGTLHLLGFDHIEEEDAIKMESLEIKCLSKLGIKNPYEIR